MDIWCIGDLNYFVSVLNGLAMLANVGLFSDLVKLGLLIAIMILGFQVLFMAGEGASIPWGKFVAAFIAFKFLFGSFTTVQVHDTYTLQEQDVDNVPYGVAVTGSILSKISHEITKDLEQAFSLPHMTDVGFAAPLITLTKGGKFITGLDTLHQGKITKTLVEYCDKCTSTGINLGELDPNAIKVAADPWNAMKWTSNIYYATTWMPSDPAGGTLRSCSEAWAAIDNYLRGELWSDWNDFLSSQICYEGKGSCDPVAAVQDGLDALAQQQQDARNYMLAAVLLPALEQGQVQFHSFMGKPEMAVIVGQAREQRNIQWMAEGSLFMNIARPMMAFFEGFLYAITPFMALLVAFVPAGIGLVGKYFMMFVWVQLWMPVMAVLNHYMQIVAQKKLAALIDGDIPLTSLQGHLMGVSQLNDWLGTAGVLVASTPAISLALLFGGAITMTHLAGRLQHGDSIDEKIARPDVVRSAPIVGMNPMITAGDSFGPRKTGMEPAAGEINVSDMAQATIASTRTEAQTSGMEAAESLRQTISRGIAGTSGIRSGVTTHDGRSSTMSTGEAFSQAYTDKLGYGSTWTAAQKQALQGMLTGGLGVGVTGTVGAGGGGGLKLGVGGKLGADARAQLQQIFGTEDGLRAA